MNSDINSSQALECDNNLKTLGGYGRKTIVRIITNKKRKFE